ncbi:transferrin-binding protein-like solute binding protein [Wielerella bovis]|uniref:transferrin-binding protein-like solute binding protein n=1 Tax=Wielerella bovis TaxID=2917790 RepID=UPI002019C297|nr:transferrin-binding protein-like solute binding protein [Wielerella bovis]MCG7659270.1 transferrin-binding protein-like solute binding protein [Wielerella bovis]
MKKQQIIWKLGTCACAVLLAACGSSGRNNNAPINSANTNVTVAPNTNASNSSNSSTRKDTPATPKNTNAGNSSNSSTRKDTPATPKNTNAGNSSNSSTRKDTPATPKNTNAGNSSNSSTRKDTPATPKNTNAGNSSNSSTRKDTPATPKNTNAGNSSNSSTRKDTPATPKNTNAGNSSNSSTRKDTPATPKNTNAGNSSNSSTSKDTPATPKNTNAGNSSNSSTSKDTPATPKNTDSSNNTNKNFSGIIVQATESSKNNVLTKFGTQQNISGNNLNTVIIDGKTVTLVPLNISDKWINTKDLQEKRLINASLSYTRFGVYTQNKDQDIHGINLIAHGQITDTSKVPTTGKATYIGEAVYGDTYTTNNLDVTNKINPVLKEQNGWAKGQAVVEVDYGTKNVAASITSLNRHFPAVNLKGTISGNTFSGTYDNYKMNGRFFGPNAEEVGGTFHKGTPNNPESMGAFGAKKQ